jgi:hypothetical protein
VIDDSPLPNQDRRQPSAIRRLSRNWPGPKESRVEWWEKFLRSVSFEAKFRTPRHSAVTTEDPLLRHLAEEASHIGELRYETAGNVVLSNDARAKP